MSKKHTLHAMALVIVLAGLGAGSVHVFAAGTPTTDVARVNVSYETQPSVPAVEPPAPAPVAPPRFRKEVVMASILVWNEANDSLTDAAAIVHMRMRSARSRNRTLEEELYYLHGDGRTRARSHASLRSDRATNPRRHDTRSWLGDVTSDLHQPLGWPGTAEEWAIRAARLRALFEYVERVIDGEIPDPCRGRALRWGGSMDHELIEMWKQRGEVVLRCGGTRNTFLGR